MSVNLSRFLFELLHVWVADLFVCLVFQLFGQAPRGVSLMPPFRFFGTVQFAMTPVS
jgi:hypothetical protein